MGRGWGGRGCGTGASELTEGGAADAFPEGEDAEGFLDTAEGDVEGMVFLGLVKDVFEAVLEEVQFIEELVVMALTVLIGGVFQGAAEMLEVAGEGGDGEGVAGGEGTEGLAIDQGVVDFPEVGVGADGTAFIHGRPPWRAGIGVAGGKFIAWGEKGPAQVGRMTGKGSKRSLGIR
jgi:hypothetical protein